MAMIQLQLTDQMKTELEARAREGAYEDVADYVRDLIQADLQRNESWEITPEIATALEEGEASGFVAYDYQAIVTEARAKSRQE